MNPRGCYCSPVEPAESVQKAGHRLVRCKVDWHLLSSGGGGGGGVFSPGHWSFLHTNTVSQDYPGTPGNIYQSEPRGVCVCMNSLLRVSFTFLSRWCDFFLGGVISTSPMVIMLPDFIEHVCECVCTPEYALRSPASIPGPWAPLQHHPWASVWSPRQSCSSATS